MIEEKRKGSADQKKKKKMKTVKGRISCHTFYHISKRREKRGKEREPRGEKSIETRKMTLILVNQEKEKEKKPADIRPSFFHGRVKEKEEKRQD